MHWITSLCFILLWSCGSSLPVEDFLNFGSEFGDKQLPTEDDVSSDEIVLREPFTYFGSTYFSLFVNSNGLISFLTEIPYFYNAQFPLDYPAIAPFYTDIDTSHGGTVWYRETSDPTTLSWARDLIMSNYAIGERYTPTSVFIVTYDGVAPYGGERAKNTFQVALITDSSESFIVFLYADGGIQWLQGAGKTSGLKDALAQAGFISESRDLYTLKASGTDQVRNLVKLSNADEPGLWIFRVGSVAAGESVQAPDLKEQSSVEEEDASEEDDYESCAAGGAICHSLANCIDYNEGFCCECDSKYFGNGKNCLERDRPIRVTGRVNGNLNGIDIKNADLHSYVLPKDGRTYTAISRIKKEIGYDLQSLIAIGEGIAWLFAIPVDGVKNGFVSTGGSFNRSVEINFPQTGHKALVHQTFTGLDVFTNVAVETSVSGSIPSVPIGSEIEVDAFQEEITKVEPGSLRSRSNRSFRLRGQSITTPFTVETFINFDECAYAPENPEEHTLRLKIADNIFIRYDTAESIVRYSFSSKIGTLEEPDPCLEGSKECGPNSQCIVDGDTYRCVCEQGYDYVYDSLLNTAVCLDVNECEVARDRCDPKALCINSPGSYTCQCLPGFTGNGYYCEAEVNCDSAGCDPNAYCEVVENQPVCRCNRGFTGDGYYCASEYQTEGCNSAQDCSPYAACVPTSVGYSCRCLRGYSGDGYICQFDNTQNPDPIPPPPEENNTEQEQKQGEIEPECVGLVCWCPDGYIFDRFTENCYDNETFSVQVEFGFPKPICDDVKCSCPEGFVYDQLYGACDPIDKAESCNVVNNCNSNALCTMNSITGEGTCVCNAGFTGDGYTCNPIEEISCSEINVCHIDAECLYDDIQMKSVCVCKPGYMGDGLMCIPQDECNHIEDCDANAQCLFDGRTQRFTCQCNSGYEGDGFTCSAKEDFCPVKDACSPNAQCYFDTYAAQYRCQCLPGFEGDGITCTEAEIGCNVVNNCNYNAECAYDSGVGKYRCRCGPGYVGDGITCEAVYSCNEDRSLCDPRATCEFNQAINSFVCVCSQGLVGNGTVCKDLQKFDKDLLLISRGLSVLRMPLNPAEGPGAPIYVDPFMTAVGADVDCLAGRFYWTDIDSKSIRSSNYDGSNKQPLVTVGDIGFPEDVAVDWVARNVFWTDSTNDVVAVATIDEGMKKTVIEGDLVNPRGIAVHPGLGLIFWSDWNRLDPKIESSGMDGTNRKKLVSGADNILLPNSLVVDHETGMVCWADAGTHRIECVGVDGYGRNRIIAKNVKYPFGLTLHYRSFYYSDWTDKLIHEVNKYTGEEISTRVPPLGGSGKVYGIVAAPETCPPVSNVCQSNRGNCPSSTICLPNGRGGRTCSCTDSDVKEGQCSPIYN